MDVLTLSVAGEGEKEAARREVLTCRQQFVCIP